ncbi:MAG: hypothetical protein ACI855_003598 [Myxococcota bacterium]|jgi:uncharacterized protein (DUF924 family)
MCGPHRTEVQLMAWSKNVLTFWFTTLSPKDWYRDSPTLDAHIRSEFGDVHEQVASMAEDDLLVDVDTALAAIIVLDQFSRNLGRKTSAAFAQDAKALRLAKSAVELSYDDGLAVERRNFLYMPFMHSETLDDHDRSVTLFAGTQSEDYARQHRNIIAAFGRYPYRNSALGRENTAAERAYLTTANAFGQ